jgi:hypothetical protein
MVRPGTAAAQRPQNGSRARVVARALVALLAIGATANAATLTLDKNTAGAGFDGVIDGFPGIATLDGVADLGGNSLAVALKTGVTEERGIAEYPLSGLTADAVTSATLTFNIDDVLSTFGPGTDFDGTASDPIYVAVYSGDGTVGLDDFPRGNRVATVATGGASITDASLASGPVSFDVDITAAVKQILGEGATHLGLVFSTDDTPTGTSIDDLGVGAAGPPGVGGAAFPFVVIETNTGPAPTPTPGGGVTPTPRPTPTPGPTNPLEAQLIQQAPDGTGDQVVLYFDARDSFTTFLNLHNFGGEELEVSLLLYSGDLSGEPLEEILLLAPGAARTIDVGLLREDGLPAQAGVAFATAVNSEAAPVVSRALAGSFTVANLQTFSAWGAAGAGRSAVTLTGAGVSEPPIGTVIDGESVLLKAIRPDRLMLAVYYDPATLQPAAEGGNQLIFLSFNDVPGAVFDVAATTTTWTLDATKNDGSPIDADPYAANGVSLSDLESLLGPDVNGSGGSLQLTAQAPGAYNRLVFVVESLDTFATGYLLPPVR